MKNNSKRPASSRKNLHSRKNSSNYQNLEPRQMLASVVADIFEPVSNPFVMDAVTVEEMTKRAEFVNYATGELVVAVELDPSVAAPRWSFLTGIAGTEVVSTMMTVDGQGDSEISLVHLDLGDGTDIFRAMRRMDRFDHVLWSAPNFIQSENVLDYVPNDPQYPNQFHHELMDNDISWDTTLGDAGIIVAITDDGVELNHDDLSSNIWTNPGETPGDGIDNDGNGYIDDVFGWDFANNNNDPNPDTGSHGTHVAGISAGTTDNGIGIAGTSGNSSIMALQFYDYGDWTATMINGAFTYAVDNSANIINTSYNMDGWVGDPVVTAAYQYIHDNDVLHFNSAGNGSSLNPARQAFEQTILVASSTSSDVLSSFTNYGTGIDITSPGSDILSTVTGNGYGFNSGTSMAAPNAAGAAALIWSANPTWTAHQVAAALFYGADNIDAQNPTRVGLMGAGRVNTANAINNPIGAPQVSFVTNLPGDQSTVDDTTIDNFSIGFDQLLDTATANDISNFELRAAGPDELLDTADDIIINLDATNTYMVGSNFVNFDVVDGALNYGLYRLTVSAGLENPFGTALDGNGDGTGGDDFISTFRISPPLLGEVAFHRGSYLPEDTVEISVVDANATGTISVEVTTSAGDVESIVLTSQGSGLYTGMINTVEGSVTTGDGALQVALGHTLTVTYEDADDGFGNPATASDTATISNIREYPYAGPPVQFFDNTTVFAEIVITDSGSLADIDVQIDVTHTYDADLDFFLISPNGTRVELFTDVGGSGDNFTGTILDDEATTSIVDGEAPFLGSYRPERPLSLMDFESITGTWTLEMRDDAGADTGTLNAWSLFIDVIPAEIGTVEFDQDSYSLNDTVMVNVTDANASSPLSVEIISDGGDVEVLTLTDNGGGLFTGMINTTAGNVSAGDGTLQVAAGQVMTVTYMDEDDGSGNTLVVTDTANITNVIEFPSSDVPVDIPDNTTVYSTIEIFDEGSVADIDVGLEISHTFDADLDVFLIAPDGTRIELFSDVGGGGNNFIGTIIDDEGPTPILNGEAPFTGRYSPFDVLSTYDGMSITGIWTLEITDDAGADQGTLNDWSLLIDVIPAPLSSSVIGAGFVPESNAGTTTAMFEIRLNQPAPENMTVDYMTSVVGLTKAATDGVDFTGVSGVASFLAGETSVMVPVTIFGDAILENDEQFELVISNPTAGVINAGSGLAVIENDDVFASGTLIDFGPESTPVATDAIGIADLEFDPNLGIGWQPGSDLFMYQNNRGDDLTSDAAFVDSGTFSIDVTNGEYDVTVFLGVVLRGYDPARYTIEGEVFNIAPRIGPNVSFLHEGVMVNDGQLTLELNGLGLGPYFRISGLLVERITGPLESLSAADDIKNDDSGDSSNRAINPDSINVITSDANQRLVFNAPKLATQTLTASSPAGSSLTLGGSIRQQTADLSTRSRTADDQRSGNSADIDNALSGFLAATAEELLV